MSSAPERTEKTPNHWVITLSCTDTPGIVHAISGAIISAHGNITESHQFSRSDTGRFFMRLQVESAAQRHQLEKAIAPVVDRYTMKFRVDEVGRPIRTLVLASTAAHCLNDLLFRQRANQLPITIPLVLSNHGTLRNLASFYGVPFESLPTTDITTKTAFEKRVMHAINEYNIELVVLARYMQILSPELCEHLTGRAINIHHSFLPGFKGANPYKQAHSRGVKLIGATAHFVTKDLDEGPIIEDRILLDGVRTIIFR
jgi:formyltetrahydrofolate deformylase